MNFQGRGICGVGRATPEQLLQHAIDAHKALRERERWEAERTGAEVRERARWQTGKRQEAAKFAEAMARSVFGRSYPKDRPRQG